VSLSPDSQILLYTNWKKGAEQTLLLWDWQKQRLLRTFPGAYKAEFSTDQNWLTVVERRANNPQILDSLHIYNGHSYVHKWQKSYLHVVSTVISPNNKLLGVEVRDGLVEVRTIDGSSLLASFLQNPKFLPLCAFHTTAKWFL
jgi:hypothetical protein